jgi:hypothetical protein
MAVVNVLQRRGDFKLREVQARGQRPVFFPQPLPLHQQAHGAVKYDGIFTDVENYLNGKVHKGVVAHAAIRDGSGFLTDHGPDHITMVTPFGDQAVEMSDCLGEDGVG